MERDSDDLRCRPAAWCLHVAQPVAVAPGSGIGVLHQPMKEFIR